MKNLKNRILTFVAQLGLSISFAGVSALMFVFGARPGLLRHKLKLGATLVALSTALSGCGKGEENNNKESDQPTDFECYGAPPETDIECYVMPWEPDGGQDGGEPDGGVDSGVPE